jgi:predicted MPP superfamily phosphohydrolase
MVLCSFADFAEISTVSAPEGAVSMARHRRRRHPLRRFFCLLLLAAALSAFFWWDNNVLQVESFSCPGSRLPAGFDGYRIVVLSDLHGKRFGQGNTLLFQNVQAQHPDCIVFTGDLVDRFHGINWSDVQTVADGLQKIAPVYYVTGNHEWALGQAPKLKATLTDAGWQVLSNRYVKLERNGSSLILAGIDDPNGYADQKTPESLAQELHQKEGNPFWILLAHRNDHFQSQYSYLHADLTISGHGHGGMIRLPFTDGLIGTQRNWFPSYTAGFYTAHGSRMFVSRGLGNSGFSFRLFNRPQIAVLTLTKS